MKKESQFSSKIIILEMSNEQGDCSFLINIMITLKIENLRKYYDNGIN